MLTHTHYFHNKTLLYVPLPYFAMYPTLMLLRTPPLCSYVPLLMLYTSLMLLCIPPLCYCIPVAVYPSLTLLCTPPLCCYVPHPLMLLCTPLLCAMYPSLMLLCMLLCTTHPIYAFLVIRILISVISFVLITPPLLPLPPPPRLYFPPTYPEVQPRKTLHY